MDTLFIYEVCIPNSMSAVVVANNETQAVDLLILSKAEQAVATVHKIGVVTSDVMGEWGPCVVTLGEY